MKGTKSCTQVHPLAAFMVRDQHGLQVHLSHNHGLYTIGHWVILHNSKDVKIFEEMLLNQLRL